MDGYVTRYICLEFASPKHRAVDDFDVIKEAVEYAAINLKARYKCYLREPKITLRGWVVIKLDIPEKIEDNFSVGNHLRSISAYILRNYGKWYADYLVGNRLLTYTEISPALEPEKLYSREDKIDAISKFTRIIRNANDTELAKIIGFLNEWR